MNSQNPHAAAAGATTDLTSFSELEVALEKAGRVEELVRLYESRARDVATSEAGELLVRAGELARERLKNHTRAEDLFRRALLVGEDGRSALEGLRRLFEQRQDSASLAEIYERLAVHAEGAESAAMLLKAADLWEQKVFRRERAVLCLQRAIRAQPQERAPYRRVRAVLLGDFRFQPAFDSLERERAALGGEGLADEYAQFAEKVKDDPAQHELARRALEIALTIDGSHARATKQLAELDAAEGTWRDRVRALRTLSLEERDRKNAARISLLVAKTFAWYDPASGSKVKEALDRCFLLWPGMPEALELLERLALQTGEHEGSLANVEAMAAACKERGAQVDLFLRAGVWRLTRLNDGAGALRNFQKAMEVDPSRAEAASLAAELLLESGEVASALEILERYLGTVKERAAQVGLRLRLAELSRTMAKNPDAARGHLEALLTLEPSHAGAAFELVRLYADAEELEKISPWLDAALCAAKPVSERVSFCEALASLHDDAGDARSAFDVLSRALVLEPTRPMLLASVTEQSEKAGTHEQFAIALRRAARGTTGEAGAQLWRQLAELLQGPLSNPVEAQAAWHEVLSLAPGDSAASEAVVRLKEAVARAEDPRVKLAAEVSRLESSGADPAQRLEVLSKLIAPVADGGFEDGGEDYLSALARAQPLFAAVGRHEDSAKAAARLAEAAATQVERNDWIIRRAQLLADKLNQKDEAAELFLALLADQVATGAVIGGLERLAQGGIRPAEIGQALAAHFGRTGDHQRQVASLLVQLGAVSDVAEKKKLLALLATTHERQLADSRAAFDVRLRALQLDPADEGFRAEAVRLARDLSALGELARFFRDLAGRSAEADPALARTLLEEASELAEEAGATDEAAKALLAALEMSPADPELLGRLVRLYVKANRVSEAEALLRRRIEASPAEERAQLLMQLVDLNAELDRHQAAAAALKEAIDAGADEARSLPRLCELLEKAGTMGELTEALARAIELAKEAGDTDRASRLTFRRAQVLESKLGQRAEAVKHYANILVQRPSDPDALSALEGVLEDEACREDAARALLPAYEAIKDHRKLVAALEVIASTSSDNLARVAALRQAAEAHLVYLRQPELAFAALARATRFLPNDQSLRDAARRAAEDADTLDAWAEVLQEIIEGGVGSLEATLRRELADLYDRKLDDRDAAVRELRAVIALEPKNQEALRSLQRLHRASEAYAALAEVLEQLAGVVLEPGEQNAFLREAALLHESKLEDKERAANNWRQLAQRDPLNREAAGNLDRLYTELDLPEPLAFALELRRGQEGQSPQGREVSFRLAQLRQKRLGDPGAALQLYQTILNEDPGHAATRAALEAWVKENVPESGPALEVLDPILAQLEQHAQRVALREVRMTSALTEEKRRLSAEIRAIYERDMGQAELAFMATLKAFHANFDREAIQPDLERLARETGSFDELAELYETAASELPGGDPQALRLFRRAAEIREQLGETEEAVRLWKALLEDAPQDRQALDSLGRLYEQSNNARSLSEVYAKQALLEQDPAERFALLVRAGEAYEQSGEDAKAIDALRSALAIEKTPAVLQSLDRLYARTRQFAAQADVLEQLAAGADEDDVRGFLVRRAQLLEREGSAAEAIAAWQQVMALDARDPTAVAGLERLLSEEAHRLQIARLLEPVYRANNDVKKLVEALDIRLTNEPVATRLSVVNEIAVLREAQGEKSLAFAARLRAFTEGPEEESARDAVERLAADTDSFEEVAAAYEDQLELGVSAPLQLDLWRRLANIYTERLSRMDHAARAWEEVARRDPSDLAVLDQLARIHKTTHAFRELALVLQRQVAAEPGVTAQIQRLFELGSLAEDTLSDKALAIGAYQSILDRQTDEPVSIKNLGRLYSETERYPELAQLIQREIELAESKDAREQACDLMVRLGRLRMGRLNDSRGALELYQAVLGRRAGHMGAVGALEEMARSESPLRGEAAQALEPVFADGGDHLKVVQMLESRVSAETVPQERVALLRRIAETYAGSMENPEMAFVAAARALRELPDEARSLELCVTLAGPSEAEEELAAVLEEVAPKAVDEASRAELYRAHARIQSTLGEAESAIASWRKVLELRSTDVEALDSMSLLLKQEGRGQELLDILRRQVAMAEDPARRAHLFFQLGALQEESLHDNSGALATFRRLLELTPDDAAALARMDSLCQKLERWPELADVLARRVSLVTPEESADVLFRLGSMREARLGDKSGALDAFRQVLEVAPRHEGTLARMEAIVEREPNNLPAVEALLGAYRRGDDPTKLVQALETRAQVTSDGHERRELLAEIATLREAEGEPELAFLALWKAFKEDPNDRALRQRLEQAADASESHDELTGAYEEALARIIDPADVSEVCLKLGELFEHRLDDPDRAINFYEKARAVLPEAAEVALPALDRLYTKADAPEELAGILEAMITLATEKADQVGLLFRVGQLYESRLSSVDRAVSAYERVLALEPKQLASARLLEPLYAAAGASEKHYKILQLQQSLVTGPERDRITARMAQVSADGLSDVDGSIALYLELLEKNPRNTDAIAALESLYEKAGKFTELRDLLQSRLAGTADPREIVRLNDRLGQVHAKHLGEAEAAIPYFKAALERDARHKSALEALRDIYGQLERKEDLITVLRRLLPLQEDPAGVKALRIRLSDGLSQLGRREEALDAARRALEIEPHKVDELARVHQLFLSLRAFNDAVRALELMAEAHLLEQEREEAVTAYFEIADLWRGAGGKPENAGPALEKVLEIDPANRRAYEESTKLFAEQHDWRAYASVLDRYLPNLVTDEEKLVVLRDLANIQESRLGQKDVAFLAACRALQLDPAADDVRETVERLAEETGSYEELAAVYEEVAEEVPRGPLAERLYTVLARVHDQELDDPQAAEASLRKILEFDPTNANALEGLAGMFSRRGRDREYVVALEQKLEAAGSIEERKVILREIARVFDEQVEDPDEAASALLRSIELEPDVDTLSILTDLYKRQKAWPQVIEALLRTRDLLGAPEARARLQVEVAQLHERELGDDEAAIEGYRTALEFDPAQAEALSALERLYTKLDRASELLGVYDRQIEVTEDWRERVSTLFKSAAIWEERFQNLANADAYIEGVLTLDSQNLQAIKTLARLRRAQARWEELVDVLERHLAITSVAEEQAELCVEIGDVFHQQLKLVDRAVTSYHQALEVHPQCRPAMHALGMLYERSGNWPFALDMIAREAEAAGQTQDAVELFHRMGKINEEMLLDTASARASYEKALAIDKSYLPCIRALKGIQEQDQDWSGYERTLIQEAEQTEDPETKARALLEVARYYAETKEERDTAVQYWEQALEQVADLLEAAQPLADAYIAEERWPEAEQMLDIVVRKMAERAMAESDQGLASELCRQLYRLGYVCEKLDNKTKAIGAYEKAYQLDATYLPALEGYGNLLVQAQRSEEALKVYQAILIHHREDLTDLEVVEVYAQIGDIHAKLGQDDRAENHFEKALAIDPGHETSLRALVEISRRAGRFDRAAENLQSLLKILDGEAKFEVALELGKVARENLNDAFLSIESYVLALKVDPESLVALDALYVLYRETRQPQRAGETLDRMLAVESLMSEPQKAKRVWFALGELRRDELRDIQGALEAFNRALDCDFRFLEAFSALEAMLGGAAQWKLLEENYAAMLQRLPKTDDTHQARLTLWRALGDLYANVLKHPEGAVMAYQVVATASPDDGAIQELFASTAAQVPGNEDKAIAAYRRALPSSTSPAKVCSSLMKLSVQKRDYEGAWLSAQVVAGLFGDAGEEEREVLTKLGAYAKKNEQAKVPLTDRQWKDHLFHPRLRGPLAELFGILYEQAGHLYATSFGPTGINPKKHRVEVASAQEYHVHHYRYVARLFGMDALELYSPYLVSMRERLAKRSNEPAPDPQVGLEIVHTQPVCLKVGGKFFGQQGQKEVYYLLGRTLALLRPELALSQRLSAERLETVLQAALSLVAPGIRLSADPRALEVERKLLDKNLSEQARTALARVAREYLPRARPDDLRNYLEGCELTATRAGYFVAAEAEPVKKMVMGEDGNLYRVSARAKIRDLVVFGVSEDLQVLRAAVGVRVEVQVKR